MTCLTLTFCYLSLLIILYLSLTKCQCADESEIGQSSHVNQTITKFSIVVEYNVYINMNCCNITEYKELEKLIRSHAGNIRNETLILRIHNCPLPDDDNSLNTMLHKLGISLYRDLVVKDYHLATKQLNGRQFRHFQGLQRLTLQMDHISLLPDDLFADATLRKLTALTLYTTASKLPSNLFENLENLHYLHIGHNLEWLAEGQFHNQKKLMVLTLANNKLKRIANNIFPSDALVKSIQLQNNSLQTLPSEMFANLSLLTAININSNEFRNLPPKLFQNNIHLNEFVLTKNRVDLLSLPEKFLANIFQLKIVSVKCGLESLSEDVFYNSTNIRAIKLDHNKLAILPDRLLESQVKLTHLDLSHNQLRMLTTGLFRNTAELRNIILANNRLQTIERYLFTKLKKLETLDLSHNQLSTNDFKFKLQLETNSYLSSLYLQNNSISDLSILHNQLPQNLIKLDLSFNKIAKLIGKNLELLYTNDLKLNLSHNHIQRIQLEDFGSYNLLDSLTVTTYLSHNPLQCDCKLLQSMKYLNGAEDHLKFSTEHLTCLGPSQLEGKHVKDVREMELLCSLEPQYVGAYKCPEECECWLRLYDKTLIVNCSHKNLTQVPLIESVRDYNLSGIELNLTMNHITTLPTSRRGGGYAECTKLFVSNNAISTIEKTQIPLNLTHLDLRENRLQFLDKYSLSFLNSSRLLQNIYLSGNKWMCDCSDNALFLSHTIQSNSTKFADGSTVACHKYHATQLVKEQNVLCNQKKITNIISISVSVTSLFLILTLYYKYQTGIKIWLYSHNICRRLVAKGDDSDNVEKTYDAFISYSHKDEDFIANHLVPELENGCPPYKLCVHVRDFLVGEYIPDQIVNAIADSSRVIVVLSKNFIESEWAKMEFKEAYRATLTERRAKIIAIMYEDIGEMTNLDKELRLYLKMNTYLRWEDPWFWLNLRYAMPHKI